MHDNVADSTREKTAVHAHRLETIDRMLEKHGASLEANTIAAREASIIMRSVADTLAQHSEKLERAISCEARIEAGDQQRAALEVRVSALEAAKKETASVLPVDARRWVQIGLIVLGVLYPALYQKLISSVDLPVPHLPSVLPPPAAGQQAPAP